jgi:DNA polymerase III epsilon subunit-like protein
MINENMSYNYNEKNNKYYWSDFFDPQNRLMILKNNTNFFLDDEALEELLKKKATFWKKRNLSFRQYIKAYYEDFNNVLIDSIKKLTSIEDGTDILYIWWNYTRILEKTIWLDNVLDITDEEIKHANLNKSKYHNSYHINIVNDDETLRSIIDNEYILLDLETTWFNKLNQIIEFWWIIYNRKINKDRLDEITKIKNDSTLLGMLKYIKMDYIKDNFNIIKNISKELIDYMSNETYWSIVNENWEEIFINIENNLIEENILWWFDFWSLLIKKELFIEKINKIILSWNIDNVGLKYNRQIHFYLEHYKDFSNSMNESIHHIKNETRTKKWLKSDVVIKWLNKLLDWAIILAHNAKFDMSKIEEFYNDFKIKWPKIKAIYDTINIFQFINKQIKIADKISFYNLDYITKLYLWVDLKSLDFAWWDNSNKDRHTAIYDVKLTNRNLIKAYEAYKSYIDDNSELLINEILNNVSKGKEKSKKQKKSKNTKEQLVGDDIIRQLF